MKGLRMTKGILVAVAAAVVAGLGCESVNDSTRDTGTMVLLFANDTVFVTVPDGEVSSGPIMLSQDSEFSAEFVNADGGVDERITSPRYFLEVASSDTTKVRFVRGTPFTGTLVKVATGQTEIGFSLYDVDLDTYGFQVNVPITIN